MSRSAIFATAVYLFAGALIARSGQFLEAPEYPTGAPEGPASVVVGDLKTVGQEPRRHYAHDHGRPAARQLRLEHGNC